MHSTFTNNVFKLVLTFVISAACFMSCQKEPAPENNSIPPAGTFTRDSTGNCSPILINGVYKVDSTLDSTHYIEIQMNVTSVGDYDLNSDTVNGIHFNAHGKFKTLGTQTIRLLGAGKPNTAEKSLFIIHYETLSSCAFSIIVAPPGTISATFTMDGAPSTCIGPVIQGIYKTGATLDVSNKIILSVNVAIMGDYSVFIPLTNGMNFAALGSFSKTGLQTIILSGTGIPVTSGVTMLSVTGAGSTCSFGLTVNDGGTPAPDSISVLTSMFESYTGGYTYFTWDNVNKRYKNFYSIYGQSYDSTFIFYNAEGNISAYVRKQPSSWPPLDIDILVLKYNNAGLVSKIYFKSREDMTTYTPTYNLDVSDLSKVDEIDSLVYNSSNQLVESYRNTNGNFGLRYLFTYIAGSDSLLASVGGITFSSYDNKINPLYKHLKNYGLIGGRVAIINQLPRSFLLNYMDEFASFSPHNVTHIGSYIVNYLYNSEMQPTRAYTGILYDPLEDFITFKYKKFPN